jgi:hypothetical protein
MHLEVVPPPRSALRGVDGFRSVGDVGSGKWKRRNDELEVEEERDDLVGAGGRRARSWAAGFANAEFWNFKLRAPNCFNPAAVRTELPQLLKRTEWVLAGASIDIILESEGHFRHSSVSRLPDTRPPHRRPDRRFPVISEHSSQADQRVGGARRFGCAETLTPAGLPVQTHLRRTSQVFPGPGASHAASIGCIA